MLKTSLPAVIDLSSQTLAWLIEAIYIGHLGAAALAGMGFALQIILLTFTVVLTFVVGASVIIVRYLGAEDHWNANHVLAQALMIGTVLSFIIAALWYFGGSLLLTLIEEDEPIARTYGVQYIRTVAMFGPIVILNFMALGIMRMVGDTLLTMKVNLFANIMHLSLGPIFIFGLFGVPRLETRGAALAVGIAHTLAFLITLYYLRSRKSVMYLSFREYATPNLETFKRLFKLGIPTTVEQLVWAAGQVILSFFAAQIGIVVLATHQIFARLQSVLSMVYQGFGIASMALVGKNIGADNPQHAMATGHSAARVAFVASFVVALILVVSHPIWLPIFTNDRQVIQLGASVMTIFALIQIPKAVNAVFTGNLRGGADLAWLMWLAMLSVVLFEVFGAYTLSLMLGLGLAGLWVIQGVDETFRLSLNFWRFRNSKWKLKDIL